ncbi:MFS transporter [Sporomusa malonica]|uniref:MFS transporter, putative metabolite:H+ symporter n=1 Tax=Sporomusa malonica TaxID=112901 RepID=A0A1W2D509_9FIRM|nr:MFS transporter [Sporomusa malonica]SMC92553.1 MFS transporter, putative metabolite:H+ symporter [Sporomusa malonica]
MATITDRLGKLPLGSFHYRLLALMGSGIAFEALDTGLIAFVLAKMIGAWNLSPVQIGYISSAGLVGMAVGAIVSGTLADRVGRKKIFVATLGIYALGTGLCGLAWNYESLLAFRFLVGAGVGGQPPVANALMSEYAPVKHRGKMLVLQNSSWAIGWLLAALIAYLIIPKYGWQLAFYIGALPALMVVYVWRILPESAMYLVSRGRHMDAHVLVSKIEQELGVPVGEQPHAEEVQSASTQKFNFIDLWSPLYIRRTICLWVLWFGMVYSYYGIFTWLPSLLVKSGHTLIRSFEFLLYMTLAQIPGYFAAAYFVDKIGRKATMGSLLVVCALSAYMFGSAKSAEDIVLWGCVMSFCNLGAWGITHAYSAEQYPTHARAAGVGWAAACGRIGGIIAPIAVGALMTGSDQYGTVFTMFTVVLAIIAMDIIFLGKETMNKSLDELTERQLVPTRSPAATKSSALDDTKG